MDAGVYATLSRQTGLMNELRVVANNVANAATTGFRQEGLIFAEHVARSGAAPSVSMAHGTVRSTSMVPGALRQTGAPLDMAIEGDGFFHVQTPAGDRLTRAGSFALSAAGDLVTPDGYRVLDAGGAPVFVPPDAGAPGLSPDGTLSAGGRPLAQLGLVRPVDPLTLMREDGVLFRAEAGVEPEPGGRILQGFLEGANVDPVGQIARLIEVQRAYEMGQSFLDAENDRIRTAIDTMTR